MDHCAKCYGPITGEATMTSVGLLCWLCFVGSLVTGELQPLDELQVANQEELTVH